MDNRSIWKSIKGFHLTSLVLLVALLAWQTSQIESNNLFINPSLWLVFGWGASLVMLANNQESNILVRNKKLLRILTAVLLFFGLIASCLILQKIIVDFPIDAKMSDVIPSLEAYVQRLLAGEKVYTAIPFEGYEVWPTYFPAMWLPYIVPELAGFDYRWMALLSFYGVYSYIVIQTLRDNESILKAIFLGIFPVLMVVLFDRFDKSVFAFATELMPISFYLLLIYGMYKRNLWLIGISIALCTLSRYAYTLWIIPFVAIIWIAEDFRTIFKIGLIGTSTILLLYVLPFLAKDPAIITDGLAYYGKTAEGQWLTQSWQVENDIPHHLKRGVSFSGYIYQNLESDYLAKLAFAKNLHHILALLLALAFVPIYWVMRNTISWDKFLSISLFAYLLLFYAFIYVPFSYLFMLPLIVGWIVWALYGGRDYNLIQK